MKKYFILTSLFLSAVVNSAVSISEGQTGEAVLLPFYTVANGLNTYINVSNNSTDSKVIRVVLREGIDSKRVMSLNVFLSSYDSWTAALGVNENKAVFTSADDSCASFVEANAIYNLWSHEVDTDPQAPLSDEELLNRVGAGWVEIYEMATMSGEQTTLSAAILTRDCDFLSQQYEAGGIWETDLANQLSPTSGGLHGSATIIDVMNGVMTHTPATHFDGFYPPGTVAHRDNEHELPNLSSADTTSLLINEGEAITTTWPTGYQAISALLMKEEISSEYNVNPAIGAWTEWVMTMPTLRFYQDIGGAGPFKFVDDKRFSFPLPLCRFGIELYGRTGELHSDIGCSNISPVPPSVIGSPVAVWATYMDSPDPIEFLLVTNEFPSVDAITYFNPNFFEGIAKFDFTDYAKPTLNSGDPTDPNRMKYTGFPVIGFSYSRFINANAQPGLLANYGSAQPYWSKRTITAE